MQSPPYNIEYEERSFNPQTMRRAAEDGDEEWLGCSGEEEWHDCRDEDLVGSRVLTYLWPGLRQGAGDLLFKAVVLTTTK